MMRIVDIFLSIPYLILAVAIATVVRAQRERDHHRPRRHRRGWRSPAIVRASFLSLRKMEYTEAARALGFGRMRMIFGHLLPNASVPIIVYGTIAIGAAILAEAALSFIGVGPQFPDAGVGADGRATPRVSWPARRTSCSSRRLPSSSPCSSFVLVGDGLRDTLDPKMRR